MKTGNIIKKLREEKGIGQHILCEAIGIEQSTLANYENNRRNPRNEVLVAIADYFCVTTDYLLGRTNNPTSTTNHILSEVEKNTFDNFRPLRDCALPRLKELRISKNLTHGQLAQKFNVSERTVMQWEIGFLEPNIKTIIALADYFNVSTDYLLGHSNIAQTAEELKKSWSNEFNTIKELLLDKAFDETVNILNQIDDFRRKIMS